MKTSVYFYFVSNSCLVRAADAKKVYGSTKYNTLYGNKSTTDYNRPLQIIIYKNYKKTIFESDNKMMIDNEESVEKR